MNAADAAFEKAFATVQTLVENFHANEKFYLSPQFSEADARLSFIDKFWMALGWDVNHETQTNPYQQEVKVEKQGTGAAVGKRADYAFSVAPDFHNVRFYVEAKKPSRDLKNADDYFQTMRYGWSSGPLSVLTDFEEFHILDCRFKPDIATALQTWNKTFHYSEYSQREKFAEIYYLFGREAVGNGALEKFAADFLPKSGGRSRQRSALTGGTQSLDDAFLAQLDEYRERLARAFKADNPQLDSLQLTEATQRVLDRLVFMRFLEDKLIEPERMLAQLGAKNEVWRDFKKQSARLDGIYNGIVFKKHFIDEASFSTETGGAVFGDICDELADNYSPYNFNTIPIHILGSIYERFLGNVIAADGSGVRVEEKPEVRKAGGVYYTPEYIVRYIVEQTVGVLADGKTPDDIKELRVCDIACGSGSFLLGVYDRLLNFYSAFYNQKKNRAAARRAGCIERDGALYLSLWQRREILLRHVFGVDIDAQAVEVAQISLYLKLLEDETTASAREANTLHGAILPSLSGNVVRGNSLVGTDILLSGLFVAQDEEARAEELKLCPMDFEDAFPQIMKRGGFDVIVGNPPYIFGEQQNSLTKSYLKNTYQVAKGQYDTYGLFIEKSLDLIKANGRFSMIIPDALLARDEMKDVRKILLDDGLTDVYHCGLVFDVGVSATVVVAHKGSNSSVVSGWTREEQEAVLICECSAERFQKDERFRFLIHASDEHNEMFEKLERTGHKTQRYLKLSRGEEIGKNAVKVSGDIPILVGGDISRYGLRTPSSFIDEKFKGDALYESPKIVIVKTGSRCVAMLDETGFVTMQSVYNAHAAELQVDMKLLLGFLNSRFVAFYIAKTFTAYKLLFPQLNQTTIEGIPLPDLTDKEDKAQHDKLVQMVEAKMLAADTDEMNHPANFLFSESPTRFVLETAPITQVADPSQWLRLLEESLGGLKVYSLGQVVTEPRLKIRDPWGKTLIDTDLAALKSAWQTPLGS